MGCALNGILVVSTAAVNMKQRNSTGQHRSVTMKEARKSNTTAAKLEDRNDCFLNFNQNTEEP